MTHFSGRTYWLIGASEGLGRSLAHHLDQLGARLILSARNEERLATLAGSLTNASVRVLDVTDARDVQTACDEIGPIDGVIYNAGAYDPMSATAWNDDAARLMVEVNLLGAMRVLGQITPRFVQAGTGDITLIGSLAGYRGLPSSIGYGASKAALISLAETMRFDLKGSGVVVRIVNPGFIKTRLTNKNSFNMPMLMSPEDAAARVLKAMRKSRFRTDFPAPFSWAIRVFEWLPDVIVFRGR